MSDFSDQIIKSGKANRLVSASVKKPRVPKDIGYAPNGKKKMVLLPANSAYEIVHFHDKVVLPVSPTPATNTFTGSNKIELKIAKGSMYNITKCKLHMRFTESGGSASVTPTKIPYCFDKIEWVANGGSGPILKTHYGATLYFNTFIYSQEQWSTIAGFLNTTSSWGAPTAISASGTKDYYLDLIGSPFDFSDLSMQDLKNDLVLRLWTQNSVSAGSGVLSLSALELICEEEKPNHLDIKAEKKLAEQYVMGYNMIDVVPVPYYGTITANTSNKISLRNLVGKCIGLIVTLRSSNSVTSEGLSTFTAVENSSGSEGTFDLLTSTGAPILGNGTKVQAVDLRYSSFIQHSSSQITQNLPIYLIPFCDNFTQTMKEGNLEGYFYFDGSEYNLEITPNSGFSTGSFYVNVHAYMMRTLINDHGNLDVINA